MKLGRKPNVSAGLPKTLHCSKNDGVKIARSTQKRSVLFEVKEVRFDTTVETLCVYH